MTARRKIAAGVGIACGVAFVATALALGLTYRPPPAPTGPSEMSPEEIARLADRSLDGYERLIAEVEAAGPDCPRAEAAVRRHLRADGALFQRAAAFSDKAIFSAKARSVLLQREKRTVELTRRMDAAFSFCARDPGFQSAIAELP